ncbi:DUF3052 domain-containing protein [Roseateles sp. BYS180W]|uniref:DUF3052 domain-containing protein n=1 Tax=Roseateles rivi TaxID=3299028 RepID=A0ABW7FXQ3_9BURK
MEGPHALHRLELPMPAGYSGTPLPKKLGLHASTQLWVLNEPAEYMALLGELPDGLQRVQQLSPTTTVLHLFVQARAELEQTLAAIRQSMNPTAAVWVSWPKKASKVKTDITEDTIRAVAQPLGLVDVKVCAVSEIWSGLKLVIRKELRG